MKVHRKLNAYGEPDALESMIAKTESRLCDGWRRDRKSESTIGLVSGGDRPFCFRCRANANRPAVVLVMNLEGRRIYVANIVAKGQDLSHEQYNSILFEFHVKFLHPAALEAGVAIEISSERGLQEAFGSEATALLKMFSLHADKSLRHPADRNRWLSFLIALRKCSFPSVDLGLIEDCLSYDGWPVDKTRKLILECAIACNLMGRVNRASLLSKRRPRTYRLLNMSGRTA